MLKQTPISTIMTTDLFILEATDSLRDAEETFRNHSLRHAPVVLGDELVGMLSLVDLKNQEYDELTGALTTHSQYIPMQVRHAMTPDPVSVQEDDSIFEVAKIFTENDFHAIPVLNGDSIVGIVSTTDVIRYFLENLG